MASLACFLELGIGTLCNVQAQAGFTVLGIRAVAEETFVREDRAHVTVEIKLLSRGRG